MRSCPTCFVPYAEQVQFCGLDGTKLVFGETDLLIGKSVERYRILEVVGDGGMARVYRASHETLDRTYAVKVLYGEVASNKTLAERFRREAKTMSKISHENVVSVVDYGTTSTGLTFLSMEMIEGETLRTLIKRLGCIPPARAAEIARQIAAGLDAAHRLGFVHRDLKPSNVMLENDDRVKLLDFGLVRATEIDADVGFLTKTGQFVGTPIYMAPEQIIGGDVDPKADLYALGVVLYEMLEGRPPFTAKKLSEIRKKHLEAPPPRARPAGGLEHLVMDLLAKTPEGRPESAEEVIARIDRVDRNAVAATELHVAAPVPEVPELLDTHAEARLASSIGSGDARRRTGLLAGGGALLALAAAGLILTRGEAPAPKMEPPITALAPQPAPPPAPEPQPVEPPPPVVVEPPPAAPPPSKRRPDLAIRNEAQKRGLTLEDLARHPSIRPSYTAWSRARHDEAAQAALLEAIRTAPIDHGFLQAKLDRISSLLADASSKVPLTALRDLEDRYLQLAEATHQELDPAEAERLLKQLHKLARDLDAATKAARP